MASVDLGELFEYKPCQKTVCKTDKNLKNVKILHICLNLAENYIRIFCLRNLIIFYCDEILQNF